MKRNSSFMDSFSQFFLVCQDKIAERGEDSYLFNFNKNAGIIGVFDGCGGSGGRKYEEFDNRTGAYLASRIVSSCLNDWFLTWSEKETNINKDSLTATEIKKEIDSKLQKYSERVVRKSTLKGSIQKDFPTTLAMCVFRFNKNNSLFSNILWSGDSRAYLLDNKGLHQLTKDDVEGEDAMSNIYNDGVLTNVISASEPYVLREYKLDNLQQGIILVSSDGCFGYLPSPMHFEYLILSNLIKSSSLSEFEKNLCEDIIKYAGDDATMCGVIVGFETFADVKNYYSNRYGIIKREYIDAFEDMDDIHRSELWESYQKEYMSILEKNIE